MPTPNVAGFLEAEKRLRNELGTPMVFRIPLAPEWPPGTKINADTGEPYDPTIERINAEFEDVTRTALIILKQGSPLRPQADTRTTALGDVSGMDLIIDVAEEDWPAIEAATELELNGLEYHVREQKPFSLAGVVYRHLIYAMER